MSAELKQKMLNLNKRITGSQDSDVVEFDKKTKFKCRIPKGIYKGMSKKNSKYGTKLVNIF